MKRITIFTILMLMVAFTAQAQKPKTGNARTTTTNKTQAAPSLLGSWSTDISPELEDEDVYFDVSLYFTFAPDNVILIKYEFLVANEDTDNGDEVSFEGEISAYGSYKKSGNDITINIDLNNVTTELDVDIELGEATKAALEEENLNESNYIKRLKNEAMKSFGFSEVARTLIDAIDGANFTIKSLTAQNLVLGETDGPKRTFEREEEKQKNYPDGRKYVGNISYSDSPLGYGTMTWRNGDKYVGEFGIFGRRDGLGLMIYANGDKYVGQWEDDERSGKGTMTYKNGRVEKGIWKDGKLVSSTSTNSQTTNTTTTQPQSPIVTKTYDNGEYVGQMKDGKRHGQGTYTYANGNKYEGQWEYGLRHGQGTFTWASGSIYVGEYKDDKRHGQGTYNWADGAKYVGEWKDDKRNGQGTMTWADGEKYVGEWKDDKRHGQGTYTWANGDKYVGQWKDNLRNGQGTMTYADGRVEKGIWKDGKLVERQ